MKRILSRLLIGAYLFFALFAIPMSVDLDGMGIRARGPRSNLTLPARQEPDYSDSWYLQLGMDRLHRHCQPNGLVGVLVDDLPARYEAIAFTRWTGAGWEIHLSSDLHGRLLFDVLIHEWAHTLAWGTGEVDPVDCNGHGYDWGQAYSRAFRCALYDIDVPPPLAPSACTESPSSNIPSIRY